MAISDDDLAKKQDYVEKLRQQVASEEAKRTEREAGLQNDITAAQLDAEASRLEAQLQAAKDANKVAAVKAGASNVTDVLEQEKADAAAAAKAANESQEG